MNRKGRKRCKTSSTPSPPPWENLPAGILEIVFNNLSLGDRVRVGTVCKYWNLVSSQAKYDLLRIPEAPWQILSKENSDYLDHFLTEVSFKSLSDERTYRFKLPINHRDPCWLCGSSRGWLLMATGKKLNPKLFLWNPLSGSTRNLPRLSTHPSYKELIKPIKSGCMDNVSCLFDRVQVFSHDSEECVVVAIIKDSKFLENQLSFCTPRDERWATYGEDEDEDDYDILYIDVIYHEKIGSLWLLISGDLWEDTMERLNSRSGVCLSECTIPIAFSFLGGVRDLGGLSNEAILSSSCSSTIERATQVYRLVEDTIHENGDVLVVATDLDRTINVDFVNGVKKIRARDQIGQVSVMLLGENSPEDVKSIGNRTILLGSTSTNAIIISDPVKGTETNCVYLATDDSNGWSGGERHYSNREHSVYFLESKKMKRIYSHQVRNPAGSKIGWFEPKILLK